MNNHLSQDQMTRCVIGQANAEEQEHGRNCPTCRAELAGFQETVATFHGVMKNWSEREIVPRFAEVEGTSPRSLWSQWHPLRWASVGVVVAVFAILPIYVTDEPVLIPESTVAGDVEGERAPNEDVLLMEEVMMHLSRPIPMPMERVMVLLPSEDASLVEPRTAEREESP